MYRSITAASNTAGYVGCIANMHRSLVCIYCYKMHQIILNYNLNNNVLFARNKCRNSLHVHSTRFHKLRYSLACLFSRWRLFIVADHRQWLFFIVTGFTRAIPICSFFPNRVKNCTFFFMPGLTDPTSNQSKTMEWWCGWGQPWLSQSHDGSGSSRSGSTFIWLQNS